MADEKLFMINYDDIIISVKANNNKLDTFMQYIVEECMKSQATKNSNKTLLIATFLIYITMIDSL